MHDDKPNHVFSDQELSDRDLLLNTHRDVKSIRRDYINETKMKLAMNEVMTDHVETKHKPVSTRQVVAAVIAFSALVTGLLTALGLS
jgi:hypothetical protein